MSAITTTAAALARQIERLSDMDKSLARITVLDMLASGSPDDEFSVSCLNLIADIEGSMIERVDEILESNIPEREIDRMLDGEGFRYAFELRRKKIAADAERAMKQRRAA